MSFARYASQLLLLLLLVCSICLAGCGKSHRSTSTAPRTDISKGMPIPRADPGYLQYLERQSMLSNAAGMAKVVSGSELAWRSSGSVGSPDEVLQFSDVWLYIHPLTLITDSRRPVFSQLNEYTTWPILREAAIQGVYISPVAGNGNLWAYNRDTARGTGEDIVQYSFSAAAGKENQYKQLMNSLIEHNTLFGSDIVPGATGIGPDFFLAARNYREYPGIYCMMEVPQSLWPFLPETLSEWEGAALQAGHVQELTMQGFLPKAIRDDLTPGSSLGGWAATGKIRGVDGNTRRWVYRYYLDPTYAVLNWEDPSQAAHRILSGSAVRQVGLLGQALIGLRFDALHGLEAVASPQNEPAAFSIEPALTAAQGISRQIRRYGGWSWLRDENLTVQDMDTFFGAATDYITDSALTPAAEHALLTGDAELLAFMADELLRLNIDSSRLVHTTPAHDGLNYSLTHLSYLAATQGNTEAASLKQQTLAAVGEKMSKQPVSLFKNNVLHTTATGLAAMALDLPAHEVPEDKIAEVRKGHTLLLLFKAMQPGMLMLSGQDIVGALPLSPQAMGGEQRDWTPENAARGTYALTSIGGIFSSSHLGMPKTTAIYPPADSQVHKDGSFLKTIGSFLQKRRQISLSQGSLAARPSTKGKGSIALVSRLPNNKSFVVTVCNFGRATVTEHISLQGIAGIGNALGKLTVLAGGNSGITKEGNTLSVTLGPWQGKAVLLGTPPLEVLAPSASDKAEKKAKLESIPPVDPVEEDPSIHAKHMRQAAQEQDAAIPDAEHTPDSSEGSSDSETGKPDQSGDAPAPFPLSITSPTFTPSDMAQQPGAIPPTVQDKAAIGRTPPVPSQTKPEVIITSPAFISPETPVDPKQAETISPPGTSSAPGMPLSIVSPSHDRQPEPSQRTPEVPSAPAPKILLSEPAPESVEAPPKANEVPSRIADTPPKTVETLPQAVAIPPRAIETPPGAIEAPPKEAPAAPAATAAPQQTSKAAEQQPEASSVRLIPAEQAMEQAPPKTETESQKLLHQPVIIK